MQCQVIGCGNPDRGDDAAGILVARRLRELGVPAVEHSGEASELMDIWTSCDRVIIVDVAVSGREPGAIRTWEVHSAVVPNDSLHYSTHCFGVHEAIELARVLGRLPQSVVIYAIEGRQFTGGAGLSLSVALAVEAVAQQIARDLRNGDLRDYLKHKHSEPFTKQVSRHNPRQFFRTDHTATR